MQSIISISNLTKTYASGFEALKQVDLEIRRGEIFALLGPNGAGKTTLINIVCGIVNASSGTVLADDHDIVRDYRAARSTLAQSVVSPVLTTSLYFVVFGAAIGARMGAIDGVSYGAFIIPGLVMLSLLTESISNASFGIYLPKWSGTIYELLSAPVSFVEVLLGYVGAATTKSVMLGILILATARLFVPYEIAHPLWMACFLVLTAVTFSLFGFIIGIWADSFQKLQVVPLMIVTPLTFLGGSFYSIGMLPPVWQKIALFNPVVYLVSAFRWSFYGVADVNVVVSVGMTVGFLVLCLATVRWVFKTGYKLKA